MTHSTTTTANDSPSIYIACLAAYNNGKLHGAWIDATEDPDAIRESIQTMLAASPEPDAEEWALHDHEGFYGLHLSEWESIDDLHAYATVIADHGKLGALVLEYIDYNPDEAEFMLEECYAGCYSSLDDFAQELLEETTKIPQNLAYYIDYERMGRDMAMNGDVTTFETAHDEVHIFWQR